MRLLLIAYEFPPSQSAQSLRWAYLARELSLLGHELHVLTVQLADSGAGLPSLPADVRVHRTFAGPLRGGLVARQQRRAQTSPGSVTVPPPAAAAPEERNWKYGVVEAMQNAIARVVFPDQRGEWLPWGRRRLEQLLGTIDFDIVIASHEPATSLQLGLIAQRRGLPLLADLGDPVLAPYTPRRWQRRSLQLEREICKRAMHVTVTSAATAALLAQRHGRNECVSVLTQGYDDRRGTNARAAPLAFDTQRLELLYTGNFYRFRRPDALVAAIRAQPDVRLTVASPTSPRVLLDAVRDAPGQFRTAGVVPHADALALQREADVLVHIANDDPCQIPGKLFEYLGSGRPVLYLGDATHPAAGIVKASTAGWVVENDRNRIVDTLASLLSQKRGSGLPAGVRAPEYGWSAIAARLETILAALKSTH